MKTRNYSKTIAQTINEFLTNDEWHYSFDEQRGLFNFGLNIKGKIKNIRYIVDVKDDAYIVYAVAPIGVDEKDKRTMAEMAEFVCRANSGLKNGNFELDMDDGEIRFKCYVDCDGIVPSTEIVKSSIYCPAAMFDRYGDGVVGIIFSDMNAKEAVENCDKTIAAKLRAILSGFADSEEDDEFFGDPDGLTLDVSNDEEPMDTETSEESLCIKTNLFDTEGMDD